MRSAPNVACAMWRVARSTSTPSSCHRHRSIFWKSTIVVPIRSARSVSCIVLQKVPSLKLIPADLWFRRQPRCGRKIYDGRGFLEGYVDSQLLFIQEGSFAGLTHVERLNLLTTGTKGVQHATDFKKFFRQVGLSDRFQRTWSRFPHAPNRTLHTVLGQARRPGDSIRSERSQIRRR